MDVEGEEEEAEQANQQGGLLHQPAAHWAPQHCGGRGEGVGGGGWRYFFTRQSHCPLEVSLRCRNVGKRKTASSENNITSCENKHYVANKFIQVGDANPVRHV